MSLLDWLFRRRQCKEDLDEEAQSHLRMRTQERMENGEPPSKRAIRQPANSGTVTLVREVTREISGWGAPPEPWRRQFRADGTSGTRSGAPELRHLSIPISKQWREGV